MTSTEIQRAGPIRIMRLRAYFLSCVHAPCSLKAFLLIDSACVHIIFSIYFDMGGSHLHYLPISYIEAK